MPNAPRTPVRSVRVPDALWDALRRIADDQGETVTEVVLRLLTRGVRDYESR